jgi:mRNA interferase MazF
MNEGDVVLTPLPQANGAIKNRPAIVLRKMPPFGDLLVCGVSSQIQQAAAGFDDLIEPRDLVDRRDFAGAAEAAAQPIERSFATVNRAQSSRTSSSCGPFQR